MMDRVSLAIRVGEEIKNPTKGNYDNKHLSDIHKKINYKDTDSELKIKENLITKDLLSAKSRKDLSTNLSKIWEKIEKEKPFKSGNKLLGRVVVSQLAKQSGYSINFDVLSKKQLNSASDYKSKMDMVLGEKKRNLQRDAANIIRNKKNISKSDKLYPSLDSAQKIIDQVNKKMIDKSKESGAKELVANMIENGKFKKEKEKGIER